MISVCMYVLNARATVGRALRSVVEQDYQPTQIVVVDGGSADGTLEIIGLFKDDLDILISEPDDGPVHAANKALGLARGDIVLFVMADDWLEPGALRAIADSFVRHPCAAIISAGARIVVEDSPGRFTTVMERQGADNALTLETLLDVPLTAARCWRRDFQTAFGGLKASYPAAHDRDWFVRALLSGVENAEIDSVLYTYVQHPGSTTLGGNPAAIRRFLGEHVLMVRDWLDLACDEPERRLLKCWRRIQLCEGLFLDLRTRDIAGVASWLGRMLRHDPGALPMAFTTLVRLLAGWLHRPVAGYQNCGKRSPR